MNSKFVYDRKFIWHRTFQDCYLFCITLQIKMFINRLNWISNFDWVYLIKKKMKRIKIWKIPKNLNFRIPRTNFSEKGNHRKFFENFESEFEFIIFEYHFPEVKTTSSAFICKFDRFYFSKFVYVIFRNFENI